MMYCLRMLSSRSCYNASRLMSTEEPDVVKLLQDAMKANENIATEKTRELIWKKQLQDNKSKYDNKGKRKMLKHDKNALCYIPVTSTAFSSFNKLQHSLIEKLNSQFSKTLPIQDHVLPLALENRSVLIQSETGSGKTLAFAIPIVNSLLCGELNPTRRCLIIAPTKELCDQIHKVFLSLLPKASSVILLGPDVGKKGASQSKQIIFGVPIIISTPAAINIKLKQGIIRLVDVSMFVMDEYDRLYKEDFEDQVSHIVTGISKHWNPLTKRGCAFITSATTSEEMKVFMRQHIPNIICVESGAVSPATLEHKWVVAPLHRRTETLLHLLETNSNEKQECKRTIIFVNKKEIGEGVFQVVLDAGYYVTMIHGSMEHKQRDTAFKDFKEGRYDVMIATDIVARGIDIPECEMVIQVQPSLDVDMYLHRAGRAARAGRHGVSWVVVSDADVNDREFVREVKNNVEVEVVDANNFLPAVESGISSVLENSLHHVSKQGELSFSIDIAMTEPLEFYQKLVPELGLRPTGAMQIPAKGKRIFGMWFSSPVEAWSAQAALKRHFRANSLLQPNMGMFRHKERSKSVVDWNSYFGEIRRTNREEMERRAREKVKREMNNKRRKGGRYKFRN